MRHFVTLIEICMYLIRVNPGHIWAQQVVNRCFKFLKFCCEEEEELNFEVMDFGLCSPGLLFKFIDFLQEECKLGHGGRLGYVDAISELIDFRKVNGASDAVLRKLSVTELYLKRARKTVAKMMRLQWTQDFDIETLEARGHYEGLLRTKYRICIYPCYVAYMNAMRNKSISRHVRYKLKVSDKTKRCPTQVKDVRLN